MKVYNVIERSYDEIRVYTYDSFDKAQKKVGELKEGLLRQEGLNEKDFITKQEQDFGEDAVIWEEDNIDVYGIDYEVFIESTSVL